MRIVGIVTSILLVVSSGIAADELPRVQSKEVGLSEKVLDDVKPGLEKLIADNKIAGAVVVVARHVKLAHIEAVGHRDLASKTPMAEDTIFAIASMTKPITCIASVLLVEEGKLKAISELPAEIARLPLVHEPGEGWTYGLSHDVLGYLIEVVSGQTLDQFLRDRICAPLDMRDTFFFVPESKRDRVVHEVVNRSVEN
jgi:CubicO group peptidase (beta-lactamase class C family)